MLAKILRCGKRQSNKKGDIIYLLNEQLHLTPCDLLEFFESHNIARKKLRSELSLFMAGERDLTKYREAGINWWDYCGQILINSYPTYFEKLRITCKIRWGDKPNPEVCGSQPMEYREQE